MKNTKLSVAIALAILSNATIAESDSRLLIFKDLASYQDKKVVDLENEIIELPDTTVLDSFKYQVFKDETRVSLKEARVLESSEENIFTINEGEYIRINNGEEEKLISNGGDFVKTKSAGLASKSFTRYTPKSKIESIEFKRDINSKNHLAQLIPFKPIENAEMHYTYAIGDISWQAKYNLHLMDGNTAKFDYFIEINNGTQKEFEDINLTISSEDIQRVFRDYKSGDKQFLFTYINPIAQPTPMPYESKRMMARSAAMYEDSMEAVQKSASHQAVTQTVMGRDYIVFSNPVSIAANSKISLDYDINNDFNYVKNNSWGVRYFSRGHKGDITMNPFLSVKVEREGDSDSVPLSAGALTVFADDKVSDATLLKEQSLSKHGVNDNLNVGIGENNSVEITNQKIGEEKFVLFSEDQVSEYDFKRFAQSTSYKYDIKDLKKVSRNNFKLIKTNLRVESENVAKDESLVINGSQFTLNEDGYNKVKKLLLMAAKETEGSDNHSLKDLSDLMNKLNRILSSSHTFSEDDLRAGINKEMYILTINRTDLPKLVFYKNGIGYLGDIRLEEYKK